ncbi:MAG: G-protein coupled receptor, partial [Candidatus Thiodiazotropha sp.]
MPQSLQTFRRRNFDSEKVMENQTNYSSHSSYFHHWFERHIPFSYTVIVYLLLGVSGNLTVLYIYLKKFKSYSGGRFFIPVLAVLDMIATVVNCSTHLFLTTPTLNGALTGTGCKYANFFCSTTTNVSIYTILGIAVDRYLKICRPNGRQMTLGWKKVSVVIATITAVGISLPYFKLVDVAVVELEDDLTAKLCIGTGVSQAVLINYALVQLLVIVAELIIMAILYFRIYKVVFRKPIFRIRAEKVTSSTTDGDSGTKLESDQTGITDMTISVDAISSEDQKITSDGVRVTLNKEFQASVRKVPRSRITVMFIVITIAFAICFIPKFVVMVLGL